MVYGKRGIGQLLVCEAPRDIVNVVCRAGSVVDRVHCQPALDRIHKCSPRRWSHRAHCQRDSRGRRLSNGAWILGLRSLGRVRCVWATYPVSPSSRAAGPPESWYRGTTRTSVARTFSGLIVAPKTWLATVAIRTSSLLYRQRRRSSNRARRSFTTPLATSQRYGRSRRSLAFVRSNRRQ